jgi:hypothetical protein
MGMLSALAMTDEELSLTLEQQIGWHLSSNHYPPVPGEMIPVCIDAIDYANEGEWDLELDMPEGISYRGSNTAPVYAIVEQHHLGAWIVESEMY